MPTQNLATFAKLDIGDVVLTRSRPKNFWGKLAVRAIRLGAAIHDQPNIWNHVAIVHHIDDTGTLWGVEGRPGGVGWVDMRNWVNDGWVLSNADQPKTEDQRAQIAAASEALIGTAYDWSGIAIDAGRAVAGLWATLWPEKWHNYRAAPGHVVCSSLADWVYGKVGLGSPRADRACTPADWAQYILDRGWDKS